jgi:DNA repair and recombination protein RAD54 and RAD54-like protein
LPPEGSDCTCDLSQWYHCSNNKGIPDDVLNQSWAVTKAISFVFHHRSNNAIATPKVEVEIKEESCTVEESDEEKDESDNDDEKDKDFVL